MRETITSEHAPPVAGPYSQAVVSGDHVFLAGQTGTDPTTNSLVGDDVAAQTQQCFDNIAAVLEAAGLSFDDVVKVNVYLTSMADFAAMNEVYARQFAKPYPARTTVAVAELPVKAQIEIDVVARRTS